MNIEKLKALMASKKQSMKKAAKTAKLVGGKNRIRLLPGWRAAGTENEDQWWHDFGQHFVKDAAGSLQAIYLCTSSTFGTGCDVCSALSKAGMHADDETRKVLYEAKGGTSVLVNALLLDSAEPNTPQVLELRPSVFTQILEIIEENGPEAVLDPNLGVELVVNREGTGLNTKYSTVPSLKVFKVPAATLARLNNLDEYVKQESEENKRKAIAAVNSVVGITLASGADVPLTRPSRLSAPASVSDLADIPDLPSPEEEAAAIKAARSDVALDSELDDLLSDLN